MDCPKCKSHNVMDSIMAQEMPEWREPEVLAIHCACMDCGKNWVERYAYSGIEGVIEQWDL